jgi:hypothetical protein
VIDQGKTTSANGIEMMAKCSYLKRRMNFSGQGLVPMINPARTVINIPETNAFDIRMVPEK